MILLKKYEKLCKLVEERETDYYIFKRISELAKTVLWWRMKDGLTLKLLLMLKKQLIVLWFINEINNKFY